MIDLDAVRDMRAFVEAGLDSGAWPERPDLSAILDALISLQEIGEEAP